MSETQAMLTVPLQSMDCCGDECCGDDCCGGATMSAQQGLKTGNIQPARTHRGAIAAQRLGGTHASCCEPDCCSTQNNLIAQDLDRAHDLQPV